MLLDDPAAALTTTAWFSAFGSGVHLVRSGDFGAIQERRLRLHDGVVVEVGIGDRKWASTDPIDPGTAQVVRDVFVPLYNRNEVLRDLLAAVAPR